MAISGPVVHKGLSLFFIHGTSSDGPVPLTLQEALAKGFVEISETQDINQLEIENKGEEEVFIQAGDVVKGGWQDRVLSVSLLLAPKSGKVPIASFCVESGRWSRRAMEDAARFSESSVSYSRPRAKLAMMDMATSYEPRSRSYAFRRRSERQQDVWASVSETQARLETNLAMEVRAAASPSSLQLSMEAQGVKQAQEEYSAALQAAGQAKADIVGVVFAINGRVHSAEHYAHAGLFAKMWPKNLSARITEAVGEEATSEMAMPEPVVAESFLADADQGELSVHPLPAGTELRQRRGARALVQEATRPSGDWVHRTYLPA